MTNIAVKLTAPEVKEILEAHLNATLVGKGNVANITGIVPMPVMTCEPGQPNTELALTFNVVKGT